MCNPAPHLLRFLEFAEGGAAGLVDLIEPGADGQARKGLNINEH